MFTFTMLLPKMEVILPNIHKAQIETNKTSNIRKYMK